MSPTFLLALAIAAPALKDPPAPPGIEGEWLLETRLVGGRPDQPTQGGTTRFVISRETWTLVESGAKSLEWPLELDTAARPPTLTTFDSNDKARRGESSMSGIYRVDGDTLTICYVFKGARPTDFGSPAGTEIRLMTLRRVKAK